MKRMNPVTILDNVGDKIGMFLSRCVKPPTGAKSVTVAVTFTDIHQVNQASAQNACRLALASCTNGLDARVVKWSHPADAPWTSGSTGNVPPSVTYSWAPAPPPEYIQGLLDNQKQTPFGLAATWGF